MASNLEGMEGIKVHVLRRVGVKDFLLLLFLLAAVRFPLAPGGSKGLADGIEAAERGAGEVTEGYLENDFLLFDAEAVEGLNDTFDCA